MNERKFFYIYIFLKTNYLVEKGRISGGGKGGGESYALLSLRIRPPHTPKVPLCYDFMTSILGQKKPNIYPWAPTYTNFEAGACQKAQYLVNFLKKFPTTVFLTSFNFDQKK